MAQQMDNFANVPVFYACGKCGGLGDKPLVIVKVVTFGMGMDSGTFARAENIDAICQTCYVDAAGPAQETPSVTE